MQKADKTSTWRAFSVLCHDQDMQRIHRAGTYLWAPTMEYYQAHQKDSSESCAALPPVATEHVQEARDSTTPISCMNYMLLNSHARVSNANSTSFTDVVGDLLPSLIAAKLPTHKAAFTVGQIPDS